MFPLVGESGSVQVVGTVSIRGVEREMSSMRCRKLSFCKSNRALGESTGWLENRDGCSREGQRLQPAGLHLGRNKLDLNRHLVDRSVREK